MIYADSPHGGDDTAALQASINAAVATPQRCRLPHGAFSTSAPLLVGDLSINWREGVWIEGESRAATKIALASVASAGQSAVLKWQHQAWRDGRVSSLHLASVAQDGADYGLLVPDTGISNLVVDNVRISNTKTAIGVLAGGYANGEFCNFSNLHVSNVGNFFTSDAGQAFHHIFSNCVIGYRVGGTAFRSSVNGGGGLELYNVNASVLGAVSGGIANTTFLEIVGGSEPYLICGGRCEGVTRILHVNSGSMTCGEVLFQGVTFTTDFRARNPLNLMPAVIYFSGQHFPFRVRFQHCRFYSVDQDPAQAFTIVSQWGAHTAVVFDGCHWLGPANYRPICAANVNEQSSVSGPPMVLNLCTLNGVPL